MKDWGVTELMVDPTFTAEGATVDGSLALMARIRDMVG